MIKTWPKEIYDIGAVIVAIRAVLDKPNRTPNNEIGSDTILIECLAELYVICPHLHKSMFRRSHQIYRQPPTRQSTALLYPPSKT